ncbi:unnamed protein product [Closterium sp. NIES-54]
MSKPVATSCSAELVMVWTPTCASRVCHLAVVNFVAETIARKSTTSVLAVVNLAEQRRRSVERTRPVYVAQPITSFIAETSSIPSPSSSDLTQLSFSWLADSRFACMLGT